MQVQQLLVPIWPISVGEPAEMVANLGPQVLPLIAELPLRVNPLNEYQIPL